MVDYASWRAKSTERNLRNELRDRSVAGIYTSYAAYQPQSIIVDVYGIDNINRITQFLDEKRLEYTLNRLSASTSCIGIPIPQNPIQDLTRYVGNFTRRFTKRETQPITLLA